MPLAVLPAAIHLYPKVYYDGGAAWAAPFSFMEEKMKKTNMMEQAYEAAKKSPKKAKKKGKKKC